MGMYDEISIPCPQCNHYNYEQSSAGRCILNTYSLDEAPEIILQDLENEEFYCNNCNTKFTIKLETVIKRIAKVVEIS